jgi:hypothetical protein
VTRNPHLHTEKERYDSRAFRLAAVRYAIVFEVDHPATQALKRRLVGRAVPAGDRGHVRFVPADLMRADLAEVLRAAQGRGDLPAALPPDGLARVFVSIYQGLALQTAWDAEIDNDAYVRAVESLITLLTR